MIFRWPNRVSILVVLAVSAIMPGLYMYAYVRILDMTGTFKWF